MTDCTPAQPEKTPAALAAEVERLRRAVESANESVNAAIRIADSAKGKTDALAEQLAALTGQVAGLAALGTQVGVLADRVTDLAASGTYGAGAADEPRAGGPLSWFDVSREQAEGMLLELAQWIRDVGSRYPHLNAVLSDCWHRHPWAVDALNALHVTWRAAYRDPRAKPDLASGWHIRELIGTVELLGRELRGCSEIAHHPGGAYTRSAGEQQSRLDRDGLAAYASWWTDGHRAGEEPGLPDTPTQPGHGGQAL